MGKNKLEKFLAVTSSLLLTVAVVLGIKIKEDDKKLTKFENSLGENNAAMLEVLETQRQIMVSREATLDKLANAAAPDTTKAVTTQTVVPGKVVTQKVPVVSSSKSSSKSSSASSSSKTTKTS